MIYAAIGASGKSKGVVNILPWIELGGAKEVENQMHMMLRNITHVLNCSPSNVPSCETAVSNYTAWDIEDSKQFRIDAYFWSMVKMVEMVRLQGGRLLVHCYQGVSRSVTLVLAYLLLGFVLLLNMLIATIAGSKAATAPARHGRLRA